MGQAAERAAEWGFSEGCQVEWANQWFPRGLPIHVSHIVPFPKMRERVGMETPWVSPTQ